MEKLFPPHLHYASAVLLLTAPTTGQAQNEMENKNEDTPNIVFILAGNSHLHHFIARVIEGRIQLGTKQFC